MRTTRILRTLTRACVIAACGSMSAWSAPSTTAPGERGYPIKPVRFIISSPPSGGTDYTARMYGQKLGEMWGQSVVLDNRPGATGMIGFDVVAHSNADGYTLLVMNIGHLITATLSGKLGFDVVKDFTPVSVLATTPVILVVHPSVNARTVQDLVALAKSQPGKLLYASGGAGGVQHVSTELLKQQAGIDLLHVPYKGTGPSLIDLISGQVQLTLTSVPSVLPYVASGKLRALAVTGKSRVSALPPVATFAESGLPGVDVEIWYGLLAPSRTPGWIVEKIGRSVADVARMSEMQEKMSRGGADPIGNTPQQFGAFYRSERDKWLRVTRRANIRLDSTAP